MMEASLGPESFSTRHTYSPESAGDTWGRRSREPRTWAWGGRLPPRLYHVIWLWASPATTQLRSRVCPSVTEGEEDSILTGGVVAPGRTTT